VQQLNIFSLPLGPGIGDIDQVSKALSKIERHQIQFVCWPEFGYQPDVAFAIAYNGTNILLKYFVEESAITAIHRATNGPVYKDSCVEFFIAFNNEEEYYNLEFNCAGSCHIGFGGERENRIEVPVDLVKQIKYQASFHTGHNSGSDLIKWELSLIIPISVFQFHQFTSFENIWCRINFYKCGDDLPQPHYLSWSKIYSTIPNFHLPEFFGKALFAEDIKINQA
jgi:hypothetical protein